MALTNVLNWVAQSPVKAIKGAYGAADAISERVANWLVPDAFDDEGAPCENSAAPKGLTAAASPVAQENKPPSPRKASPPKKASSSPPKKAPVVQKAGVQKKARRKNSPTRVKTEAMRSNPSRASRREPATPTPQSSSATRAPACE